MNANAANLYLATRYENATAEARSQLRDLAERIADVLRQLDRGQTYVTPGDSLVRAATEATVAIGLRNALQPFAPKAAETE